MSGHASKRWMAKHINVAVGLTFKVKIMGNLITEDEVKHLKTNPRHLSWKDAVLGVGIFPPIVPVKLKSGYLVSYTIDSIFLNSNIKIEHVMVGADGFEPDPADMDEIAHTILGDCVRAPMDWGCVGDGAHYLNILGLDGSERRRFYEEGLEIGAGGVQ